MINKNVDRYTIIDILRVIGTMLVILAHVNLPRQINLIRSFDVCLLVLISGYVYGKSPKKESYREYVWKRIKRLCIPSYIMMIIIFSLCLILCFLVGREYPYSNKVIFETFLFIGGKSGGIGFFWIVRIYLIMALIAPSLKKINKEISSNIFYFMFLLTGLILNNYIYILTWNKYGAVCNLFIENYIMSLLAYACVYSVGIRIAYNEKLKKISCVVFSFLVLPILFKMIFNENYSVSSYKYPPRIEYIIYGIWGTLILWVIIENIFINYRKYKIITWLSKESFNIYLVHILVLFLMSWGNKYLLRITILNNWIVKFIVIIMISIISVIGKNRILKTIKIIYK